MGYSPREVDDMTIWEMNVCWAAWKMANIPEEGNDVEAPSSEEYYDMLKRLG
jgi:hypothetical protein